MKKGWPGAMAALGLAGISSSALGASEQDFLGEVPIVLSVSRLAQPVSEAPSATTIIDREMIRASGFRELSDVLRLAPGFYVGNYNGTEPVVSHGLPNRYFGRMQVLVDGRSVYTPLFGQVPWTSLPLALDDIERIEVVRGPNAASFGANSFLGVINIITRHAAEDAGALISLSNGGNGVGDVTARHGGKAGAFDYRLTAGFHNDGGFANRPDDKRISTLSGRADRRLNTTDSLQLQGGVTLGVQSQGYVPNPVDTPRDQNVSNYFMQLRWQRVSAPDDEMSLQLYHTAVSTRETTVTDPFTSSGLNVLTTNIVHHTRAERWDVEAQRIQSIAKNLRVVWGGSARLDQIYSPLYLGSDKTERSRLLRGFGNVEWHATPDLVLNAGAMWEHNSITGSDISPRVALNYHLTRRQTLRLGYSQALRTPTMLEERGNYNLTLPVQGLGLVTIPEYHTTGGLAPERIASRELAYLFEAPEYRLAFDVRAYHDSLDDLIDTTKLQATFNNYYVFSNKYQATLRGIETQARWRGEATRVWFSHAYSHIQTDNAGLRQSTPHHMYSMLASQDMPWDVQVSAGYYRVTAMEPLGDGTPLKPYQRYDFRLAKSFKLAGQPAELSLIIQNAFKPYSDFRRENQFDTRSWVTFRLGQ
ncbi:MAG: TonB-dependent receptor [Hydrogenophilales bacterium]|nr:TonB-dependent receptor [Hydrogenophilales bacterium]